MCPVYKLTNYVKPILSVYNVSNTGYYFYNVLWHSTGNKVNTMQCILLYGLVKYYLYSSWAHRSPIYHRTMI